MSHLHKAKASQELLILDLDRIRLSKDTPIRPAQRIVNPPPAPKRHHRTIFNFKKWGPYFPRRKPTRPKCANRSDAIQAEFKCRGNRVFRVT